MAIAAVMPRPTCAGVLGMERTMALSPMPAARLASVVPAAIESVTVPRPTSPRSPGRTLADDLRLDRDDDDLGLDAFGRRRRHVADAGGGEQRGAVRRRRRIDDHHRLAVEAAVEPALEQRGAHLAGADQHQRALWGEGGGERHGPSDVQCRPDSRGGWARYATEQLPPNGVLRRRSPCARGTAMQYCRPDYRGSERCMSWFPIGSRAPAIAAKPAGR